MYTPVVLMIYEYPTMHNFLIKMSVLYDKHFLDKPTHVVIDLSEFKTTCMTLTFKKHSNDLKKKFVFNTDAILQSRNTKIIQIPQISFNCVQQSYDFSEKYEE